MNFIRLATFYLFMQQRLNGIVNEMLDVSHSRHF